MEHGSILQNAVEHPDPEIEIRDPGAGSGDRERQDLDWWVGEGRRTLESGLL